jgi:hypothetical protein
MRLLAHVARMTFETARYAVSTRRVAVLIVLVLGLALLAISVTAQTVAPLALYPFA